MQNKLSQLLKMLELNFPTVEEDKLYKYEKNKRQSEKF
jgi:hypothetical protein